MAYQTVNTLTKFLLYTPLLLVIAVSSGCATYSDGLKGVYSQLEQQKPQAALKEFDKNPGAKRDRLAYLLNRAVLLRMTNDFVSSNAALEKSKTLIEDLNAFSIIEQTGALAINDAQRSYAGEPHEHILLHLYAALNYLQLDQIDSARVEILQVNLRLQKLAEALSQEENTNSTHAFNEEPFAYYLTGMIYDELGEWSDAMIAYRHAYKAYRRSAKNQGLAVPLFLEKDLLRLSNEMGLDEELSLYKEAFNHDDYLTVNEMKQQGELIFILHNGLAPMKKQHDIRVMNFNTGRLISIALPYYVTNHRHAIYAEIFIDGQQHPLTVVSDIAALAHKTLEAQLPALTLRAIARAVIKDNAARRVNENTGPLAGFLINIAAAVTEVADTRSWWSLPHNIQLMRTVLPPGNYKLSVKLYGQHNNLLAHLPLNDVTVTAGEKTFHELHWIKPTLH